MRVSLATLLPALAAQRRARSVVLSADPPELLNFRLLAMDSGVISLFCIGSEVERLCNSPEVFEPPVATLQDWVEISATLNGAAALVLAWSLAAAASGLSSAGWLMLPPDEHAKAPLGLHGLASTWALAAAPGLLLRRSVGAGGSFVADAACILAIMYFWRRYLLEQNGQWM